MSRVRVFLVGIGEEDLRKWREEFGPEWEAAWARGSDEVVKRIPRVEPDFILIDLDASPSLAGQLRELFGRRPECAGIPIIGVSNSPSPNESSGHLSTPSPVDYVLSRSAPVNRWKWAIETQWSAHNRKIRPKQYPLAAVQTGVQPVGDAPVSVDAVGGGAHVSEASDAPEVDNSETQTGGPNAKSTTSDHILVGGKKIRVLAVDDEPDVVTVLRYHLGDSVEFISSADGLEAAEKARRYLPDVFIVDWMIPKMSGIQFLQWLRKTPEFQRCPVIFLTAKGSEKDRRLAKSLGAQVFISKPFNPRQITDALRAVASIPGFEVHKDRPSIAGLSPVAHKPGDDVKARVRQNWAG